VNGRPLHKRPATLEAVVGVALAAGSVWLWWRLLAVTR
jgi:hypothetical protein